MKRERALALQKRGLRDWIAMMGAASPGASFFERGGVAAAIVPACAQRSICNSVTYGDAGELEAMLDELAGVYEAAGIAAWTVWAPEFDREAIALLEAAGHKADGAPTAMSLELDAFKPLDAGDLEWDAAADPADLGALNDRAYGLPENGGLAPALAAPAADPNLRLYAARVGGSAASVLGAIDHGDDLGFYFVATDPAHRGHRLGARLMSVALSEARERGLRTSSLQASSVGRPVYRRLGYAEDFALTMYERRAAA